METFLSAVINGCHSNLAHIYRYSGTMLVRRENLAEHSYYVALIADMLATDISAKFPETALDREKILRYALLHDFEEAVTGDIVTTPKYASKAFRKALEEVGNKILTKTVEKEFAEHPEIAERLLGSRSEYEEGKYEVPECRVVKFADMLQALSYSVSEFRCGNSVFESVCVRIAKDMGAKFGEDSMLAEYVPSADFLESLPKKTEE